MAANSASSQLHRYRSLFGDRLQENVTLANYTTARVGGKADALLIAHTTDELAGTVHTLWESDLSFYILGAGSNVLVSDQGVRGLVIVNRARNIRVDTHINPPTVRAESPGTVGGAVYGNAGAYGSDVQHDLVLAEILHRSLGKQTWTCSQMEYGYRTSILKRQPGQAIILAATFALHHGSPEDVKARMESLSSQRRRTQPPGASMGSMFKNPPGDYAGRLIEAAGLKGTRVGGVEISTVHANFFINYENATATDYYKLIQYTQETVFQKFGIRLELEVELLGDWTISSVNPFRNGKNGS